MRELITRMTVVDDDAATALRVISHFDTLTDHGASIAGMLRAAAALAGCPAGAAGPGGRLRFGADGERLADHDRPMSAVARSFESVTVWLERKGRPRSLDSLILERCARSIHLVGSRPPDDAVRIACDPQTSAAERVEVLRSLGLGAVFTVVATYPSESAAVPVAPLIEGRRIQLLASARVPALISPLVAAGLAQASADDVVQARQKAATALRLAVDPLTGGPAQVRHEELGSLAALAARFEPGEAAQIPDVRQLRELTGRRPWATAVLAAVLSATSVREAARRQNLHHSTLQQRISWLEQHLGYSLLTTDGHSRAAVTLLLWRIAAGRG